MLGYAYFFALNYLLKGIFESAFVTFGESLETFDSLHKCVLFESNNKQRFLNIKKVNIYKIIFEYIILIHLKE